MALRNDLEGAGAKSLWLGWKQRVCANFVEKSKVWANLYGLFISQHRNLNISADCETRPSPLHIEIACGCGKSGTTDLRR
jgi:hypothetical protein